MGDAQARRFQAELREGRWQEFHDFVADVRDWDARSFYVTRLSDIQGRPAWLEQWVAARPGSAVPLLLSGSHRLNWAWQARGSGRANTVEQDSWPVFYARLVEADRELAQAAVLDPADPTPHAQGIRAALGLDLGITEKKRRFGEVARRDPWNTTAHTLMIQALAAKWSGSHEEMFAFARTASAQAPDGHAVHKVIPLAHLEKWLNLPREAEDGKSRQLQYFLSDPVREEIRAAADRSIRSPSYVTGKFTASDRNVFAMCFSLMQDYEAQLEQMDLIGPFIHAIPWQYQGNPGWAYERARGRALEKTPGAGGRSPAAAP